MTDVYKTGFIKGADGTFAAYYVKPLAVDVWGTQTLKGVVVIKVSKANLLPF